MKPQVYFPLWADSKFDISKAKTFGEPVFALEGCTHNPFDTEFVVEHIRKNVVPVYRSEDFIGLTGNPVHIALLSAILHQEYDLNMLLFDARSNEYRLRTLKWEDPIRWEDPI